MQTVLKAIALLASLCCAVSGPVPAGVFQICLCVATTSGGLSNDFVGLDQTQLGGTHNTTIPVGVIRVWDNSNVSWNAIEASPGVFNFTNLDALFDFIVAIPAKPSYVMGRTPCAEAPSCTGTYAPNGSAWLPSDISGANIILPRFLTALANHIKARYPTLHWIIEGVNESDLANTCGGTVSGHCDMNDLVTYQKTLYQTIKGIDSNTLVGGPSASTMNSSGPHLYGPISGTSPCPGTGCPGNGFLKAGGGAWMDFVNIHPYFFCGGSNYCTTPEAGNLQASVNALAVTLNAFGLGSMPIAMGETAWGTNGTLTSDQMVGYLGREYTYFWDDGISYVWWYQWDCNSGVFANCFGTISSGGTPTAPGLMLQSWRSWTLSSSHIPGSGTQDANGTWTFPLVQSGGTPAEIIFNPSSSRSVSVPGFTTQLNYDGTTTPIVGSSVTASPIPILVR